jgi:hypothetical protein
MNREQWERWQNAEKLLPTIEELPLMTVEEYRARMKQYKAAIAGLPKTIKCKSVTRRSVD